MSTAPTSLTVTSSGPTAVALAWTAPSGPAPTNYTVYRSPVSTQGAWGQPVSIGTPAALVYTDSAGTAGATYLYQVSATTGGVESPASNAVAASFLAPVAPVPPVFSAQLATFFTTAFAQTASYTRYGYAPVSIQVIFNAVNQDMTDHGMTANSSKPTALCRTTDVPNATNKDSLVISGLTYYVKKVAPDGEGMTILTLSADRGQ